MPSVLLPGSHGNLVSCTILLAMQPIETGHFRNLHSFHPQFDEPIRHDYLPKDMTTGNLLYVGQWGVSREIPVARISLATIDLGTGNGLVPGLPPKFDRLVSAAGSLRSAALDLRAGATGSRVRMLSSNSVSENSSGRQASPDCRCPETGIFHHGAVSSARCYALTPEMAPLRFGLEGLKQLDVTAG